MQEDTRMTDEKDSQQQPNRCIFCGGYTKGTKECFCPQCFNIRRGLYFVFCLGESFAVSFLCAFGAGGLMFAILLALAFKICMVFYMKSICVFVPIPLFYMVYKPPLKKDLEEAKRISISPVKPTRGNKK